MSVSDHEYIWKAERDKFFLVRRPDGTFSIRTRDRKALLIEDDGVEKAVIERMLKERMPIAVLRDGELVDENTDQPM